MTDDLVGRGAARLGEVVVVEGRRVRLDFWSVSRYGTAITKRWTNCAYVALDASLVDDLVDLIGRDTRLRGRGGNVEDLSSKLAGLSHSLLALVVEDVDLVAVRKRAAVLGIAVLPPCWVRDGLGQGSMLGQRVNGAEGAGEGIVGERVVVAGRWIW